MSARTAGTASRLLQLSVGVRGPSLCLWKRRLVEDLDDLELFQHVDGRLDEDLRRHC